MTDKTLLNLDMTFSSNTTVHDDTIKVHYTNPKFNKLGVRDMKLQDGTTIKIYDMERKICDIIRTRNKIDPQILNTAVQEYFNGTYRIVKPVYDNRYIDLYSNEFEIK